MIIEHAGKSPNIDPTALIAPDATVCGDVIVGPGSRILHGARIIGESGGTIRLGSNCIVMENAVIRATRQHPCTIGDHCLIGPNTHVVGAMLDAEVFVATAVTIFHGARLGRGAEVRPHAVVHLRTNVLPGGIVPIGWIAVGDPVRILPPDRHEEIWAVQKPLNFPEWVYGFPRDTPDLMRNVMERLSASLGAHAKDQIVHE